MNYQAFRRQRSNILTKAQVKSLVEGDASSALYIPSGAAIAVW